MLWHKVQGAGKQATFSPQSLIGPANIGMYYDPTDPSNYTLSGSNVTLLQDLGPYSIDLPADTTGPTISTVNGLPQLTFTAGTSAALRLNDNTAIILFNRLSTICCIVTPGSSATAGNTFWAPNITIADMRDAATSTSKVPFSVGKGSLKPWLGWYDGNGTVSNSFTLNSGATLTSGTSYVMTFVADNELGSIYLNGSLDASATDTVATGSRAMSSSTRFTLGARTLDSGGVSDPWDGHIGPFFAVNRVLTSSERSDLESYFLSLL